MLALVIGIVFFLVKGGNVRIKIGLVIMVLLGLMALVGLSLNTDMGERFERTLSKGDTAGRETIFLEAVAMVNEKPLMGWGPNRFTAELGKRVGKEEKAAHNLYLKLLLEVGILGAVPFLLGLGMCFRAAWKARYGLEGSLPVAMLVTLLMLNMSGSWDNRKIFWIVLAYALVSTRYTYSRKSTEDDSCSGKNYGVGFRKTFKKSDSSVVVGQTH